MCGSDGGNDNTPTRVFTDSCFTMQLNKNWCNCCDQMDVLIDFTPHFIARAQLSSFHMCLMLIMTKHDAQVVPVGVNMMHCNSQFVAQYTHTTNLKESLHDSCHNNTSNQKTWKSWRRRRMCRMNDDILESALMECVPQCKKAEALNWRKNLWSCRAEKSPQVLTGVLASNSVLCNTRS